MMNARTMELAKNLYDDCWTRIPWDIIKTIYDLPSYKDHVMRNISGDTDELIGLSDEEEEVESKCPESFLKKHTRGSPDAAASKKREREMQSESTGGVVKSSWPEVVGWSGEAAVEQIEKDNGNVVPIVVKVKPEEISLKSEKVRPNIVKIFVDDNGLVIQPPITG